MKTTLKLEESIEYYTLKYKGIEYEVLISAVMSTDGSIKRGIECIRLDESELSFVNIPLFNKLYEVVEVKLKK